ncbi:hypothetical protein OLK001_18400 [Synechocystis sp. LKSZ1]
MIILGVTVGFGELLAMGVVVLQALNRRIMVAIRLDLVKKMCFIKVALVRV